MAKYKTEVEAPPVPHMFFEVGDVVETPSGKVFRHYGQGKWAQENYVSFETSPGGGIELTVAGEAYDPLAISPYYHFHGFAGGQVVGDGFLYDQASVNHGSLGANLENATAWALPGFLSLAAPTPVAPRTDVALPPISFDYSAGEKLLVWWLAKASAPAATMSFCGDGNSTARPGLRIRANAAGSFDIALHSISFSARYSLSSSAVAFDGTLHSAGVLIDGESKKYGMWVDESATHPAGQAGYSTLASGGEADTRTASQFYIGSAGTTEGIAASVRAFVVIRLPPGKACPSIALVTDIFKRFRASPGCVLSQGAL